MTTARAARVRAPELAGRGWLNTGGRELRLADLRGRIVLVVVAMAGIHQLWWFDPVKLTRTLVLNPDAGSGVLQVTAQAATCDAESPHPACHLTRLDWGVPVTVGSGGATELPLALQQIDQPGQR